MSNVMQDLHTIGLNPFAVVLLAESVLKSPIAPMTVGAPQGFFFPIQRGDCAGWRGVRFTVEAVPVEDIHANHQQAAPLSLAARSVLAERRRQVEEEGWTREHDDTHINGELADAAAMYATSPPWPHIDGTAPRSWPWNPSFFKPRDRRSNMVRAAALLLAEIERLDRADPAGTALPEGSPGGGHG